MDKNGLTENQEEVYCPDCGGEVVLVTETPKTSNAKEEETFFKEDPDETIGNKIATRLELVKPILFRPISFFKTVNKINKNVAIQFAMLIMTIGIILNTLWSHVFGYSGIVRPTNLWFYIILIPIGILIETAFIHSLLFIFRGINKNFWETSKVVCFKEACFLLMLIPYSNIQLVIRIG